MQSGIHIIKTRIARRFIHWWEVKQFLIICLFTCLYEQDPNTEAALSTHYSDDIHFI